MIITFSGPSGAGKTTLISNILASNYFKKKKVKIINEDTFFIPTLVKRIIGIKIFRSFNKSKIYPNSKPDTYLSIFNKLVVLVYPFIVLVELYIRHIVSLFFKDEIIIFDRYSYDYYVTYKHNFKASNPYLQKIILKSPQADLSFLLLIDKTTSIKRNKNNLRGALTSKISFHTEVINEYKKIANYRKLISIENNADIKRTSKFALDLIKGRELLLGVKEISLCGPDGTGKSTLSRSLRQYANDLNIKLVVVHFFHANMLYKLGKKTGLIKKISETEEIRRNYIKSANRLATNKPFIWAFMHFTDAMIQYFFLRLFFWNKIIVYDRYFYDFLISFSYHKVNRYKIFNNFIPRIKNTFILLDTAQNIFARKPENTLEFFDETIKLYKKMAKLNKFKVIDIRNKNENKVFSETLSKLRI